MLVLMKKGSAPDDLERAIRPAETAR